MKNVPIGYPLFFGNVTSFVVHPSAHTKFVCARACAFEFVYVCVRICVCARACVGV